MKHIFIINPIAGNGKNQSEIIRSIDSLFVGKEKEYEIYITRYKGDAKEFVIKRCDEKVPYIFYACGGDGTLHEVINGAAFYEHAIVGHIPCGSGNDFVKNFAKCENFSDVASQVGGYYSSIDLIKVKDEYAASVCNIGFDADAAFNMHKFKKIPFVSGTTCYILSVLYCMLKKLGKNLDIEFDDGEKVSGRYLLSVVSNGHSYGGGYKCAPLAKINDGLMDICLVKNISRLKILGFISSYKIGKHIDDEKMKKYITYKKNKRVKIKSDTAINLCIDGESCIADEFDFMIAQDALKFWIPEGACIGNESICPNLNT